MCRIFDTDLKMLLRELKGYIHMNKRRVQFEYQVCAVEAVPPSQVLPENTF